MRKTISDSTLDKYWRQAVRLSWGAHCAFTGEGDCFGVLECHHILKRARPHLRWLVENGILLCLRHHKWAKTISGNQAIRDLIGYHIVKPLELTEQMLFPEYLQTYGITRIEYKLERLDFLKKYIKFPHHYLHMGYLRYKNETK